VSEGGEGTTEIVCFEVVLKTSKRWTITDILWEWVPGGGSRNTKSTWAVWKIMVRNCKYGSTKNTTN